MALRRPRKMNEHPPEKTEGKRLNAALRCNLCRLESARENCGRSENCRMGKTMLRTAPATRLRSELQSNFKRRINSGRLVAWFSLLILTILCARFQAAAQELAPFHVGFSTACFSDVNENDAKAAVKVWAQELARERGIRADPQPYVLKDTEEIVEALNQKRIDAVSLPTDQYNALKGRVAIDQIIVSVTDHSIYDEYSPAGSSPERYQASRRFARTYSGGGHRSACNLGTGLAVRSVAERGTRRCHQPLQRDDSCSESHEGGSASLLPSSRCLYRHPKRL